MNERIKQLAEQAGIPSLWTVGTDKQGNPILEKFAELIVKECMDCSTWVGKVNKNVKEPGLMHTAHAINQRIKKHFGVEE